MKFKPSYKIVQSSLSESHTLNLNAASGPFCDAALWFQWPLGLYCTIIIHWTHLLTISRSLSYTLGVKWPLLLSRIDVWNNLGKSHKYLLFSCFLHCVRKIFLLWTPLKVTSFIRKISISMPLLDEGVFTFWLFHSWGDGSHKVIRCHVNFATSVRCHNL